MKHKNFFIVPNQIFELDLKPKEFVVYISVPPELPQVRALCAKKRKRAPKRSLSFRLAGIGFVLN